MFIEFRNCAKDDAKNNRRYWEMRPEKVTFTGLALRIPRVDKTSWRPPLSSPLMELNACSDFIPTVAKNDFVAKFMKCSWKTPCSTLIWDIYTV